MYTLLKPTSFLLVQSILFLPFYISKFLPLICKSRFPPDFRAVGVRPRRLLPNPLPFNFIAESVVPAAVVYPTGSKVPWWRWRIPAHLFPSFCLFIFHFPVHSRFWYDDVWHLLFANLWFVLANFEMLTPWLILPFLRSHLKWWFTIASFCKCISQQRANFCIFCFVFYNQPLSNADLVGRLDHFDSDCFHLFFFKSVLSFPQSQSYLLPHLLLFFFHDLVSIFPPQWTQPLSFSSAGTYDLFYRLTILSGPGFLRHLTPHPFPLTKLDPPSVVDALAGTSH